MSVLIKGMEMPKHGEKIVVFPDGSVFVEDEDNYNLVCLRRTGAKAKQLPPHWRLIDADALMKQIEHDTPLSAVFEKTMKRYLHNAPTILPADKEGEA